MKHQPSEPTPYQAPIPNEGVTFRPNVATPQFTAKRLKDGNIFPVGESFITGEPAFAVVDIQATAHEVATNLPEENLRFWEDSYSQNPAITGKIDPKLLGLLTVLNDAIGQRNYSANPDKSKIRHDYYAVNQAKPMSAMLEVGAAKCAEVATLTQLCLQELGVESEYVSGGYVSPRQAESGTKAFAPDSHAYIAVHHQGQSYVYDPYHAMKITEAGQDYYWPAVYKMAGDFPADMKRRDRPSLEVGEPITTQQTAMYSTVAEFYVPAADVVRAAA